MFIPSPQGADASTVSAAAVPTVAAARSPLPPANDDYDGANIRLLLFGSDLNVQRTILQLHKLRYAEPNDWSRPLSTGRAGEVMVILTKRMGAE